MFIPPDQQARIGVRWAEAGPVKLSKVIRSSGRIDYDERKLAVVNPRYAGWIRELSADFTGKRVARGQQLALIHSPELLAARKEHLIAIAARQDTAWSATDMLDGDPALATRGRLMNFGLSDDQIRALESGTEPPELMEIRSPIDGILVEKEAVEGAYFEPGTRLFLVADLSNVWVHADVYENEIPFVRVGQPAEILRPEAPATGIKGVVSYVYPFLDETTRTVRVRVELANPAGAYKPGMFVTVLLRHDTSAALGVPADAVMRTGTRELVFVDAGEGHLEMREVATGMSDGTITQIVSGVTAGERVAHSANFLIDAEARIRGLRSGHDH
jgi:Cu(I)/Ag(I) efflux system membrane fusion protein